MYRLKIAYIRVNKNKSVEKVQFYKNVGSQKIGGIEGIFGRKNVSLRCKAYFGKIIISSR